jgi:hypothetical protein
MFFLIVNVSLSVRARGNSLAVKSGSIKRPFEVARSSLLMAETTPNLTKQSSWFPIARQRARQYRAKQLTSDP